VVVTESLWERQLLLRLCGAKVSPAISIIGVDTGLFRVPLSRDALRAKYNLPSDSFVIVSNRYLGGHYNGWFVVEAIRSILERCPDLILLYVNPSKMGPYTREKAELVCSRFPQIKFIEGPLPHSEIPNILGCGDIYVTFSSADGVPNSLLEAMACGLVPVAADLPQLREWIEDGESGYLVPQARVESLAATILKIYSDRRELHHMSRRCISRIHDLAAYEKCSERVRSLLLEHVGKACPNEK
jgi:glycosyltransferase involved in cell wall biosynthesis